MCPQIREISPFLVNKGELWGTGDHDLTIQCHLTSDDPMI